MRTLTICLSLMIVLLLQADAGEAQAAKNCDPDSPLHPDCTLKEIHDAIYRKTFKEDQMKEVREEVVDKNKATTSPDPFASQLHASYQDFLNLFSFAVNQVEETADGQALIVRFNPLRKQPLLIGSSLTLTKPSIADSVSKAIPEAIRSDTLDKLNTEQEGYSDQTWSLSISPATGKNKCSWADSSRCWGREPSTYYDMLSSTLEKIAAPTVADNIGFLFAERLSKLECRKQFDCKASDYPQNPNDWEVAVGIVKELAQQDVEQTQKDQKFFNESGVELLSMLIDNQPQFSLSGSYRNRDRLGGPDEFAASLELQFGLHNLNDLKGECPSDACVQKLRDLKSDAKGGDTTKFVLTASYRSRKAFSLKELALDEPVTGFEPISIGKSKELKIRGQAGWDLSTNIAGKNTRLDLALDGIRISGDIPAKDKQNRWVGTATFTMPLGDNVSVPVTLKYANKPEFLSDQKRQLGMHFGLSWRLPFDSAAGNGISQ